MLDCSQGSHALCDVDVGCSAETKLFPVKKSKELDSPEARKAVIQRAHDYHKAGALVILWLHLCNPGGSQRNDDKLRFAKTWASFADVADYIQKLNASIVITCAGSAFIRDGTGLRGWLRDSVLRPIGLCCMRHGIVAMPVARAMKNWPANAKVA